MVFGLISEAPTIAVNSLDFGTLQYIKVPPKACHGVVFQLMVSKNFCIANVFPVRKLGEIWNLIMRNHQIPDDD